MEDDMNRALETLTKGWTTPSAQAHDRGVDVGLGGQLAMPRKRTPVFARLLKPVRRRNRASAAHAVFVCYRSQNAPPSLYPIPDISKKSETLT